MGTTTGLFRLIGIAIVIIAIGLVLWQRNRQTKHVTTQIPATPLVAQHTGSNHLFSPRQIMLLHLYDDVPFYSSLGNLTLANKRRYATRHGYEFVYHTPTATSGLWQASACDVSEAITPPSFYSAANAAADKAKPCLIPDKFQIDKRAPTFGKIKLTIAACETRRGYWALWSDADALIVNQTIPLETIIDDKYDIHLTADWLMINAGMILFKCSNWTLAFLNRVYAAREFDSARALDQSAFQHFFDEEPGMDLHLKILPKYAMNVYAEEYRPGDFLLHMAGKLYEAAEYGAVSIAHQFDILSMVDDYDDVAAFFQGPYFLNYYSGICDMTTPKGRVESEEGKEDEEGDYECKPEDARRLKMKEPLIRMSSPNRYRHVGLRYYWLHEWFDKYDTTDWNDHRILFDPSGQELNTQPRKSKNNDNNNDNYTPHMTDAHDEL